MAHALLVASRIAHGWVNQHHPFWVIGWVIEVLKRIEINAGSIGAQPHEPLCGWRR
jgi:hypothetical protein